MFLPSSVRIAICINRCSFRISDGWQRKKPLHPPEIHSFRLDACFLFLMLLSAFSAAGFLLRYSEILPGCVLRSQYQDFRFFVFFDPAVQRIYGYLKFIRCIYRPYFFASFTACTLYSFSYCLFSDIPFPPLFLFPFFFFEVEVPSFIILHHSDYRPAGIWACAGGNSKAQGNWKGLQQQ